MPQHSGWRRLPPSAAVAVLVLLVPAVLPARAAEAPDRGKQIYQRCGACHSLERNRSGPKHCGLFGRRAGSLPGYAFSLALRESGIIWDSRSLDRFLENPMAAVPGTKMGYAGIKDSAERAALIAYLEQASRSCDP